MVSQLTTVTSDGLPSNNAQQDCVPACVGAAILYYQGKSGWDSQINPDMLKDAAYGEAYQNMGTAAAAYVPICNHLGFDLSPINGAPADLVAQAHTLIQSGSAVIFTEPDPYVPASYGWSHVCVFWSELPGSLTSMDPYIARPVTRSDSEWAALLQFNQIWILKPTGDLPVLQLSDPMGRHFTQGSGNAWHCAQTNVDLIGANLAFYRQYGGIFGLPLTNELHNIVGKNTAIVVLERAVQIYDPQATCSPPAGAASVYLLKVTDGIGQQLVSKPLTDALNSQIAALKQQLATASNPAALTQQIAAYQRAVSSVRSSLATLP